MIDIDRTLRLLDVEAESNFVQAEAIDAINYLREENARLLEENDAYKMDGGSCANEVKRLHEENARLREVLKLCDEAMAWCLGGGPIGTLMIEARRAARAALKGDK